MQRQVLAVSVLNCGGPQLQFIGQLVRRLRGFWNNLPFFHVKVNLDREVDSRGGNLDIICTSSIWQFMRQLQRLLEEFQVFLYVEVDSFPEVDSWAGPGAVRTRKFGHYSYELSDDV